MPIQGTFAMSQNKRNNSYNIRKTFSQESEMITLWIFKYWWPSCRYYIYRVFIKNGVFFQESSKVCHLSLASCRLLLVVKNYQSIGVFVHSHCVKSFNGLLQWCRRERGCSELWKNTILPLNTLYMKHCFFEPLIIPSSVWSQSGWWN